MKKTRLLALTSLCSVLAGMPANAQEIKDSDAKKIGGVETKIDKESPDGKNKNEINRFDVEYIKKLLKDPEFIKYAKWMLGFMAIEGTHEGLSYFKGKSGQFYEKPARFSLTGYVRKRRAEKEKAEKIEKFKTSIEKFDHHDFFTWIVYQNKDWAVTYSSGSIRVSKPSKVSVEILSNFNTSFAHLQDGEFKELTENIDFYYCYSYDGEKPRILLLRDLKGNEAALVEEANGVTNAESLQQFKDKFYLASLPYRKSKGQ